MAVKALFSRSLRWVHFAVHFAIRVHFEVHPW